MAIEGTRDGDTAIITKVEEDREELTDSALDTYLECNPLAVDELVAALLECIGATGSEPPVTVKQSPAELLVGTWQVTYFFVADHPAVPADRYPDLAEGLNGWEWEFTAHTLNIDTWDANRLKAPRQRWSIEPSSTTISVLRLEYDEYCMDPPPVTDGRSDLEKCLDEGTTYANGGVFPGKYVIDRSGTVETMMYQWLWFGEIPAYLVFRRVTK